MKQYADKRNHAKNINLQIGDYVLVRQQKKNKLSTIFGKTPYRVTEIKATMITATIAKIAATLPEMFQCLNKSRTQTLNHKIKLSLIFMVICLTRN